jgi:hypothetical protein
LALTYADNNDFLCSTCADNEARSQYPACAARQPLSPSLKRGQHAVSTSPDDCRAERNEPFIGPGCFETNERHALASRSKAPFRSHLARRRQHSHSHRRLLRVIASLALASHSRFASIPDQRSTGGSKASAAPTTRLFAEQPRQRASEANCLIYPRNLFGCKVGLLPKLVIVGLLKFVGSLPHLLYETAKLLTMPRRTPIRSCRRHSGAANRGSLSRPVSAVSPIRRNCPSARRSCRPRTAQSAFRGQ